MSSDVTVPNPQVDSTFSWSSLRVRRREDQLWLDIDIGNLVADLSAPNDPRLRRTGTEPGFIAVRFPSQHVAEPVRGQGDQPVWPVDTRRAGVSRLVFRLPDDVESIPLTEKSLLSWGELALQVSPAAGPRGDTPAVAVPIAAPTDLQTSLEVPWRMMLSPPPGTLWANATAVVTHGGRAELWHTRMASAGSDGQPDESVTPPTMRALWCTDDAFSSWLASPGTPGATQAPDGSQIPAPGLPFRLALTPRDRVQIVRASSDYTIPGYTPDPVDVDQVILSSLGASVSLRGVWSPPSAVLSILGWQHHAALGRDQAVRVVSRGYLLPFGQPAARVQVVERVVEAGPGGVRIAGLRATEMLILGQPTRTYPAFAQRFTGRALPFSRVTVSTTLTSPLDAPEPLVAALGNRAFVPRVGGDPLSFGHVASDSTGRTVTFDLPAVFVDSVSAFAEADMAQIRVAYNALPENGPIRRSGVAAQVFAYAPTGDDLGDTDVETHAITFELQEPLSASDNAFVAADQPRAHAAFAAVAVRMAAVAAVTRSATAIVAARLDQRYLENGFGAANQGEVFLGLVAPVDLTLPSDRGALMDPGLRILALSRRLGPVGGDLDTLAGGLIDVPAMLAAAPSQPKIFGAVSLSSIVQAIPVPTPGQPAEGAVLLSSASRQALVRPDSGMRAARATDPPLLTRLSFEPKLQSDPLGILNFKPDAYARVSISIDLGGRKTPQPDDFRLDVLILNERPWRYTDTLPVPDAGPAISASEPAFTLRLFGKALPVIEVDFSKLVLSVQPGKDPEVVPAIVGMRFDGVLRFVQSLKDAISGSDGVVSGREKSPWGVVFAPNLEFIEVGVSYSLPDIPLGVLTLKNIRFGVSLQVPYFFVPGNRRPLLLTFAFASRHDPFLIAVYVWGGGGYATISLRWGGIQLLEIGFEFGLYRQLGGGALSGSIELMVGIHFQVESDPATGGNRVELTAYVRARGELTLFKIVTVSLELYMGLTYLAKPGMPGTLVGQARVTLTVSVLFFSASVSYLAEHRFSGGAAGDPTFEDQMPTQGLWDEYATAFAVGR
jgi:hypothetical protein